MMKNLIMKFNYLISFILFFSCNSKEDKEKMFIGTRKTESQTIALAIEKIEPSVETVEILFKNVVEEFGLKNFGFCVILNSQKFLEFYE